MTKSIELDIHNAIHKPIGNELISLAKKVLVAIAIIWVSLYLFEVLVAPELGLKHIHFQITSSIVIIGLSLLVITAVRRLVKRSSARIGLHLSALISFFIIVTISLIATLAIMHVWQLDLQSVLIGGGVAAIIIGIALSTIVGNILSGGLMLTTFPAKVGDSIFIVNDNIHGIVEEVNFMYTKVLSDVGTEYIVPNSAIVQGNIRVMKEPRVVDTLPFAEKDHIEITAGDERYAGVVTKINPRFTFLASDDHGKEIVLSNASILSGKYVITKDKK
jgi:small-conductance mechanosensitive channel